MGQCQQKELSDDHRTFVRCEDEATTRVWCPTWITAEDGPLHVCEKHARTFQPEHNENASRGTFYWDDEADRAWAQAYPKLARWTSLQIHSLTQR